MNKDTISKIIEAGNMAPSGGNSQPWKFRVRGNVIEVTMLPEKDHPVMNFRNRGTLVALGALIENMEIASAQLGFDVAIDIFPSALGVNIILSESALVRTHQLDSAISKRHSNRKIYKSDSLTENDKEFLFQESRKFPDCQIAIIEKEKLQSVGESLAVDIMIFLQNKLLHKLFFKEIIWNEEEQKIRGGLYIRTMEAVPPKSIIFKAMQHWKIAQFFSKIKLPKKIYEESVQKIVFSGLLGVILVPNEDLDFVHAGRLLENIWLRATELDLGFQLVSGSLFLWQRLHYGDGTIFSDSEQQTINHAYEKLAKEVKAGDKIIALAFRIGRADQPLAVSYKRPPVIIWEQQ